MSVRGAALNATVTVQARSMLVESYGLPMGEYAAEVVRVPKEYPGQETLDSVVFTRHSNGATIRVEGIYVADDGEILQCCLRFN